MLSINAMAFNVSNTVTVTLGAANIVKNIAEFNAAITKAKAEDLVTPRTAANPFIIDIRAENNDSFSNTQLVVDTNYVTIKGTNSYYPIQYTNSVGGGAKSFASTFRGTVYPIIYVNSDSGTVLGVKIQDLVIEGKVTGALSEQVTGIGANNADIDISNVTVKDLIGDINTGNQYGSGIYAYNSTTTARTINIDSSTVSNIQKAAVYYDGHVQGSVTDNTFTNSSNITDNTRNGIVYGRGGENSNSYGADNLTITGNTFTGYKYDDPDGGAAAILHYNYVSGTWPNAVLDESTNKSDATINNNTYVDSDWLYYDAALPSLYDITLVGVGVATGTNAYEVTAADILSNPTITLSAVVKRLELVDEAYGDTQTLVLKVTSGKITIGGTDYTSTSGVYVWDATVGSTFAAGGAYGNAGDTYTIPNNITFTATEAATFEVYVDKTN
jgi:hypothetical protein